MPQVRRTRVLLSTSFRYYLKYQKRKMPTILLQCQWLSPLTTPCFTVTLRGCQNSNACLGFKIILSDPKKQKIGRERYVITNKFVTNTCFSNIGWGLAWINWIQTSFPFSLKRCSSRFRHAKPKKQKQIKIFCKSIEAPHCSNSDHQLKLKPTKKTEKRDRDKEKWHIWIRIQTERVKKIATN